MSPKAALQRPALVSAIFGRLVERIAERDLEFRDRLLAAGRCCTGTSPSCAGHRSLRARARARAGNSAPPSRSRRASRRRGRNSCRSADWSDRAFCGFGELLDRDVHPSALVVAGAELGVQRGAILGARFLRLDRRRRIGLPRRQARSARRRDAQPPTSATKAGQRRARRRSGEARVSSSFPGRSDQCGAVPRGTLFESGSAAWFGPGRGRRAGRTRRRCPRRGSCGSSSRSRRRSASSGMRGCASAGSSRIRRPGNGFQGIRLNLHGTSRTSAASSCACSTLSFTPSSITYSNVTKSRGARSR